MWTYRFVCLCIFDVKTKSSIFLYVDLYVHWTSECTTYTSSMHPLRDPKLQALYICIHVCVCVCDCVWTCMHNYIHTSACCVCTHNRGQKMHTLTNEHIYSSNATATETLIKGKEHMPNRMLLAVCTKRKLSPSQY